MLWIYILLQLIKHVWKKVLCLKFNLSKKVDFGECNLAAVYFGGTLVLNICENFYNKELIKYFIDVFK